MKTETDAVFLFIAELTGSFVAGSGNMQDKIKCGEANYIGNYLPELDLESEEGRKDLHELVWLKRLYKDLDGYFSLYVSDCTSRFLALDVGLYREANNYKWSVYIELDASASMLQYMGILLNDKRLMSMTNIIGETLQDPWDLEGMPRLMLKKAATPMLYGSSKQCYELWQDNNMPYTPEQVAIYTKEMADGAFGVANLFKEFILNNAKPKAEMDVDINGEVFSVSCNRFRKIGEKTKAYKVWDTIDRKYNTVLHTDTRKIPDLKQFRRYFVTLLIHNLDSQVCNSVTERLMDKYGSGIPIHDAILCSPAAALDVRKWYAIELKAIHDNRKLILKDFFKSIGITGAAQSQWKDLQSKIHQFEEI